MGERSWQRPARIRSFGRHALAFARKISAWRGKEPVHRRLEGAEAHRGFIGPFVQIRTGSKMIAAFGDDEIALVACDTETGPVKGARGAECIIVSDGLITYSRFVFDQAPFDAARKASN